MEEYEKELEVQYKDKAPTIPDGEAPTEEQKNQIIALNQELNGKKI